MFFCRLLSRTFALLLPFTVAATVYLYLYPVFKGCAFPLPQSQPPGPWTPHQNALLNTLYQHLGLAPAVSDSTHPAIFKLLVLADPQLEGDTSLPFPEYELYPRLKTHWRTIHQSNTTRQTIDTTKTALSSLLAEDIPRALKASLKRLDLIGNDYYLAHIYRTLSWWSKPSHVTVLGDLLGSQWISDEEFARRTDRFWNRVFRGTRRVDDAVTRTGVRNHTATSTETEAETEGEASLQSVDWSTSLINIAGNHDIGYAGDVSPARMDRFEAAFGRANWDVRFTFPSSSHRQNQTQGQNQSSPQVPSLHLINLNTLVFDTPALSADVQSESYAYLNELIAERVSDVQDRSSFTLLLTHLPLHKADGVCADGPMFSFWDEADEEGRWEGGGLKEQNHLSDFISAGGILQGIFGLSGDRDAVAGGVGRNGIILTGHDHVGCDAVHFVNRTVAGEGEEELGGESESGSENERPKVWQWAAKRFDGETVDEPSIREVTLRSMMGEFGGNAGLLSAWFDEAAGEWDYEITMCPAGVQHIWWAVHILVLVTMGVALLWLLVASVSSETKKKDLRDSRDSKIPPEKKGQDVQKK